jgi:CBS domain-containing protein
MRRWTVGDVMTREVVTARPTMTYKSVADLLVKYMVSAAPVVDDDDRVIGVVSEIDLLSKIEYGDRLPHHPLAVRRLSQADQSRRRAAGTTAADAMTTPAITITEDASLASAARMLDAARVKRLPVVTIDGRLTGIVSRRDLVRLYARSDESVRVDVVEAVRALGSEARDVEVTVRAGAATLSGLVPSWRGAHIAEGLARGVPGVIVVANELVVEHPPMPSPPPQSPPPSSPPPSPGLTTCGHG